MRASFLILSSLALCAGGVLAAADWHDDRGPGLSGVREGDATVYPAQGFNAVAFGGAATADVRVGPTWSVRATGPADAIAEMRVRVAGERLMIDNRQPDRERDSDLQRQVHFAITLPRLGDVALGGSGRMTVDRVAGTKLGVTVDSAKVSIGGSGSVTTAGTARDLTVSIGGSGSFDAPELRAQGAKISTAGSGSVRASVDGPATVSTVGSGHVDLGTGAHCRISRMGHSEVRCGT